MKPKLYTLRGLLVAIEKLPEAERDLIAKGAARFLPPPVEPDEDERAFPVDEIVSSTT